MENAGHRVVEFLAERVSRRSPRSASWCSAARATTAAMAWWSRGSCSRAFASASAARGAAGRSRRVEGRCGGELQDAAGLRLPGAAGDSGRSAACATLVVDALLGTGINGPATGRMLEGIREINQRFSAGQGGGGGSFRRGCPAIRGEPVGEFARADYTVTFTAPKVAQVLPPNCDHVGELRGGRDRQPAESLYEEARLSLVEPAMFRDLLAPRARAGTREPSGTCWWWLDRAARPARRRWPEWRRCAPARAW